MADVGAGAIYAAMGRNIADSINNIVPIIDAEHKKRENIRQLQGAVDQLTQLGVKDGNIVQIDPNIKDKGIIPIIQSKAKDSYLAGLDRYSAETEGRLSVLKTLGMRQIVDQLTNPTVPVQLPGVGQVNLSPGQAATYSAARQRATTPSKTTNPDLNYGHAVLAHKRQIQGIEDYFDNNLGAHPGAVLDSSKQQGFVWDPDQNKYVNATGDRVANPDLVQMPIGAPQKTGETKGGKDVMYQPTTWLTQDQLVKARPLAEQWQQLQQNPPKREDYQTAQPGFVPDNRALQIRAAYKAGKISSDEAIKALQAQ